MAARPILLLFAMLAVASPAQATGGIVCRPVAGSGPTLSLVIGHGAAPAIVGASLAEGSRILSTSGNGDPLVISQSWIDKRRLWLDLVDAEAMRFEGKLRAGFARPGSATATGSFERKGRTYRVQCAEG